MTHPLPVFTVEVCQHSLEARHGGVPPLSITQFQEHVALHLLNGENRADRTASLGYYGVETPVTSDRADHRAGHNPVIDQQGTVGGVVGAGDPTDRGCAWKRVVPPADQIVDVV